MKEIIESHFVGYPPIYDQLDNFPDYFHEAYPPVITTTLWNQNHRLPRELGSSRRVPLCKTELYQFDEPIPVCLVWILFSCCLMKPLLVLFDSNLGRARSLSVFQLFDCFRNLTTVQYFI